MEKTKIDWCDSSWNPVTGCYHGCSYCYARWIAVRFGGIVNPNNRDIEIIKGPEGSICFEIEKKTENPYPAKFGPTFHKFRLGEYQKKKSRNIFVCSMADLFGAWVPDEWIEAVFADCLAAPQHNYLFLTKNPDRYIQLAKKDLLPMVENFWYGSSVTGPDDLYTWFSKYYHWFLSVEPILADLGEMSSDVPKPDWIIVGAETGRRRGKVVPPLEWIEKIKCQCERYEIPLFMKSSLADIWPGALIQEFPERLKGD